MKAIKATLPQNSSRSEGEGACDYYFPELLCDSCGERWLETEVWYPSLSLVDQADTSKFNRDVTVSPTELAALRRQVSGSHAQKLRLVPGAGIGPVIAKAKKTPTEFIWCGFKLLATRRSVDLLEKRGITLPHGPVIVQVGAEKARSYVALELDSIPLWDETTLRETTVVYCRRCGGYSMHNEQASLDGLKRYVKQRMPKNHGLVRVNESYVTLATETFIKAFREEGFTGMEFVEEGVYV